jgi:hypothetical protein
VIDLYEFDRLMNRLGLLPSQAGIEADLLTIRKESYYQILSPRLSTEQFAFAAEQVLATSGFFPTPSLLIELGGQYVDPEDQRKRLPRGPRSPEQIEADREEARRVLAQGVGGIRVALIERGLLPATTPAVVRPMRPGNDEDEARWRARCETLQAQAQQIQQGGEGHEGKRGVEGQS